MRTEETNPCKVEYLLKLTEEELTKFIDNEDFTKVNNLLQKHYFNKNSVKVAYSQGKKKSHGRLYSVGTSLQSINKEVRKFITCDLYNDFDMANACPTILNYIIKTYYEDEKFKCLDFEESTAP